MTTNSKPTFFELLYQSLQDVEGGYDLLAPKFDRSRYITPDEILQPFFEKLQKEKGSFDYGIDVCCGTGAASKFLVPLCQKAFTGLDLSQGMLQKCKTKLAQQYPDAIMNFIKANALEMPFENKFDVVVSFGAFGHILENEESLFIQQIHKILKPGGHFFFITTGPLRFWSLSLWRQKIFNGILRVRNFFITPKFIMYYLTFRLPEVKSKLENNGFKVTVFDNFITDDQQQNLSDLLPFKYSKMVMAEKM